MRQIDGEVVKKLVTEYSLDAIGAMGALRNFVKGVATYNSRYELQEAARLVNDCFKNLEQELEKVNKIINSVSATELAPKKI
jgi:hypothetical protein